MGRLRILMLLLAAGSAAAGAARGQTGQTKRIFIAAPMQWDHAMLSVRPALQQTATDFMNLTGGFTFGMTPTEVNQHLPEPSPGLSWSALPAANEYPGDVRYFWTRIDGAGPLRLDVTACMGSSSYVVFLFNSRGLFRLSYRLLPDPSCASPSEAAQQLFARYMTMGSTIALSVRYRTGTSEVVDITDPTASFLIPVRWRQGVNN